MIPKVSLEVILWLAPPVHVDLASAAAWKQPVWRGKSPSPPLQLMIQLQLWDWS